MKGQLQDPGKWVTHAITMILVVIVVLGAAAILTRTVITSKSIPEYRQLIDFSEAVLNANCLVYEENGNFLKGVFDKTKLDSNPDFCVEFTKLFFIQIEDKNENVWFFPPLSDFGENIYNLPFMKRLSYNVVIRYPDGENVPAIMEVYTE